MTATARNPRIDILKGLAIIATVIAHTGWHAATTYTDALPKNIWLCVVFSVHTCVPVFMLLSGYFYDSILHRGRMRAYLNKLLWLGIIGCALLAVSNIFFRPEMYDNLTARSWLRFLVLGEYPLGEPMWYIPAIIGALLLMRLADKMGLWPKAAWGIMALGAAGMILSQLPGVSPDWGRNALLMGFPLLAIGRMVARCHKRNVPIINRRTAWILIGAGLVVIALESVRIMQQGYPLPFTPGLLITALGMLLVAVCTPTPPRKSLINKALSSLGRGSGIIYIIHGAVFPLLAAVLPHDFIYFTGVLPALTLTSSWVIALLARRVMR